MKYFYDCEFIEDGLTIDLISIAVVAEDGRELYLISNEFDERKAGPWVRSHVLNKLPSPSAPYWQDRTQIRKSLENFFHKDKSIELWAWVGAYDHVVLCQLWGSMPKLPDYMPRFTHELKQLWEQAGKPTLPHPSNAHDALGDARDNVAKYRVIESKLRSR